MSDGAAIPYLAQTYDPYGTVYASAGSGASSFGYTGEQVDGNGLVYLRARYYQPGMGRFFQLDPSRQEVNLYGYVTGNPVNFTDPSGLAKIVPPCNGPEWYCTLLAAMGLTVTAPSEAPPMTPVKPGDGDWLTPRTYPNPFGEPYTPVSPLPTMTPAKWCSVVGLLLYVSTMCGSTPLGCQPEPAPSPAPAPGPSSDPTRTSPPDTPGREGFDIALGEGSTIILFANAIERDYRSEGRPVFFYAQLTDPAFAEALRILRLAGLNLGSFDPSLDKAVIARNILTYLKAWAAQPENTGSRIHFNLHDLENRANIHSITLREFDGIWRDFTLYVKTDFYDWPTNSTLKLNGTVLDAKIEMMRQNLRYELGTVRW